jgi:hypothetical protein
MSEFGQHSSHFTVLAFREHHLQDCGVALLANRPDEFRAGLALGKPDAFEKLVEDFSRWVAGDNGPVDFFYPKFGVR